MIRISRLALATAALTSSLACVTPSENPNIIFILADDMGYGDPGFNNPDSKTPTTRNTVALGSAVSRETIDEAV